MRNASILEKPFASRMRISDIGGGRVIRQFSMDGKIVRLGTYLTAEQIQSIHNRAYMIGRFIDVWPKASVTAGNASSAADTGADQAERHVVTLGFGRYNVIEGTVLNEEPLSRADAYALAGKAEPMKRGEQEH